MTNIEYKRLIDLGFDNKQINQLENLSEQSGINIENLAKKFEPMHCDDRLLRKLNNALKKDNTIKDIIGHIINLIKLNVDFEPILNTKVTYKINAIYSVLSDEDEEEQWKKEIANIINYKNVDNDIISLIWDDIDDGIHTGDYLKENLTKDQIYLAHSAIRLGYNDVLEIVDQIGDGFDDADAIHEAIECGLDIISISHTQNPALIYEIISQKCEKMDVYKFLDNESDSYKLNYVSELIKKNFDDDKIRTMLEDLPLHKYKISSDCIVPYIDLYNKNVCVKKYLENGGFGCNYLKRLLNIYDHLDKEDFPMFEREDYYYNNYELDLMEKAIIYERKDVFKALAHVTEPDEDAYSIILKLLEEDHNRKIKSPIPKLLYDKGNDVFNDYSNTFEFSAMQKAVLSMAINRGLSYDDIEPIRDANINYRKMRIIGGMIENHLDITVLLNNLNELSDDEMKAVYICERAGLTVTDENFKNKDLTVNEF